MKKFYYFLLIIFTLSLIVQGGQNELMVRVDPQNDKGFSYPYYFYSPLTLSNRSGKNIKQTILVIPNNTGGVDDDLSVHDNAARRQTEDLRGLASKLEVAILVPVFPRPKTDWQIYTQALDRDSMLTKKNEYRRLDLQLIQMIDDARKRFGTDNFRLDKRVFMLGFSASGMFTNRFAFLHPDRIKAAVFGSPGGWAIAPLESWENRNLRYPIGIADLKFVTGKKLDMKKLKNVPLFLFLGDEDKNDSVVFRDSYEEDDEKIIFELFGKTLLERWEITKKIYAEILPKASLKLYPKVGHSWSKEIWTDVSAFFSLHKES